MVAQKRDKVYNYRQIHTITNLSMENTARSIGLSLAFVTSLFAPASALAYLSPDQVFGGSSITLQAPPPPTAREGEQVNQVQQQRAAERRTEAQSSLQSVTAEQPDTYQAPTAQPIGLFNNDAQYEQRMQRIQAEKSSGPTIIIGGNGDVIDANGNVLHSGAPRVSSTGPETVLTGLAIALAAMCTFGFAAFQSRRAANKPMNA